MNIYLDLQATLNTSPITRLANRFLMLKELAVRSQIFGDFLHSLVSLNLVKAELSPKRYRRGSRPQEMRKRGIQLCAYTYRYTVTTRMTCIKVGSDERHFDASFIVKDKVTGQCPQTMTNLFEEKGEPKRRESRREGRTEEKGEPKRRESRREGRAEEKGEPKRNRTTALSLTAGPSRLTPSDVAAISGNSLFSAVENSETVQSTQSVEKNQV